MPDSKLIVRKDRLLRLLYGGAAGVILIATLVMVIPLPERLALKPSPVVRFHDGVPAHVYLSDDGMWRMPVHHTEVDPRYLEALLAYEDSRFWYHPGVDPFALVRAAAKNIMRGHVVSGASTITMQLVRVLEPRPRTLRSKALEILRALQLELRMSKAAILDAYLSHISFGRNIEGVEAASWSYFGHGASLLTAEETGVLLAVPQSPAARYPRPENQTSLESARRRILRQIDIAAIYSGVTVQDLDRMLPAPVRLKAFPRLAPHASGWVRSRHPDIPEAGVVTTLDSGVQRLVERFAVHASREARNAGVRHMGVAVLNHHTREIAALSCGPGFFRGDDGDQIPCFDIPRSPGSALKPFIFGYVVDRGLALPGQLVEDVPRTFGGYSPKNYDGAFSGLVRLDEALSRSLNLPFVNLLELIGVDRFAGFLHQAGAASLDPEAGRYGLSVAAGGIELTMLDMLALYGMLANDGWLQPMHINKSAVPDTDPLPVFQPGTAWLVREALRQRDRPDFPRRRHFARWSDRIFWKTGTSFGHRDAWAAGALGSYTAVVWFGNLDQKPSAALVGGEIAAPLLFDVLEALAGRSGGKQQSGDDPRPEDLAEVEVCADSGFVRGPACPHAGKTHALRHAVSQQVCPYHIQLDIDQETGLSLHPLCREGREYRREIYTSWPASVRRYLADTMRGTGEPPPLHPACVRQGDGAGAIRIVSPRAGQTYLLIPGMERNRQEIPFEADSPGDSGRISWFINGRFLGSTAPSGRFFWEPSPGTFTVTATDEAGRIATRTVVVRDPML